MSVRSTACKNAAALILPLLLALLLPAAGFAAGEEVIASIPQGLSAEDAGWRECPLGDYVADAVRAETGAQAALVPAELLADALVGDGSVTADEAAAVFTADADVRVYELTPAELKDLLEESVSHLQLNERERLDEESSFGGFLQLSGIVVTADATAAPGDRILTMTLDGETLDPADGTLVITAAVPGTLDPGAAGRKTDRSLAEMTRDYIASRGTVEVPEGNRIRVIGAHERDIISVVPVWFFAILLVLAAAGYGLRQGRIKPDHSEKKAP